MTDSYYEQGSESFDLWQNALLAIPNNTKSEREQSGPSEGEGWPAQSAKGKVRTHAWVNKSWERGLGWAVLAEGENRIREPGNQTGMHRLPVQPREA